jgi:secreted trypsin-like serine protease
VIVHPDFYVDAPYDSDIALLRLAQPVALASTVQIVPVAGRQDAAYYVPGAPATVTGWGTRTWGEADYPDKLYEVTVPIVDQAACAFNYAATDGEITDNMLCAGLPGGGKDSCQGDSGGPLVVPVGTGWKQVGIVSWGNRCALPYVPGVYTHLPNFIDWLADEQITLISGAFMATDRSKLPGHSIVGDNRAGTMVRPFGTFLPNIRR